MSFRATTKRESIKLTGDYPVRGARARAIEFVRKRPQEIAIIRQVTLLMRRGNCSRAF